MADSNSPAPVCVCCAVDWREYSPEMAGYYRVGEGTVENPVILFPLCEECLRFTEEVVQGLVILYTKGVRADAEGRAT